MPIINHVKMNIKRFIFICMAAVSFFSVMAQPQSDVNLRKNQIDTATQMIWTGANFSYQFPFGTLAETFKNNWNIGTGFTYKTSSNWTIGLNFNYLFGSKIKDQVAILGTDMLTQNGDLIDGNGLKATIYFEGRYWNLSAGIGKIIPFGKWRNSGLWLRADFGYFEHKIRINDPDKQIPQLLDDYKKGYDQLAGGFCMSQFIGYIFMRRVREASFYAGIEVSEIWSKSLRNYSLLLHAKDDTKKFSILVGPKIGWIIPLYEKRKIQTLYQY